MKFVWTRANKKQMVHAVRRLKTGLVGISECGLVRAKRWITAPKEVNALYFHGWCRTCDRLVFNYRERASR